MRLRKSEPLGLRLIALVVFTVLPLSGPAAALLTALLLPLATACLLADGMPGWMAVLMTVGCVCGALQSLPYPLCGAALVLCAGVPCSLLVRRLDAWGHGLYWLLLFYGAAAAALALAVYGTEAPLRETVADAAVAWVDASPDCIRLLTSAYQFGLARLPAGAERYALIQVGGTTIMPMTIRTELLNSLRTSLLILSDSLLTRLLVNVPLSLTVLCTALPDRILSRNGGWSDLPRFENWGMTTPQGIAAGLLALGFAAEWGGASGSALFLARLCAAAFGFIYGLQGMAAMWAMGRRARRNPTGQVVWIVVSLLIFPTLLVVYGVMDQLLDSRRLRHEDDAEGNDDHSPDGDD